MERGRDESNFRAKRSRLHGKNIIRGMGLSFSRDNARRGMMEKRWVTRGTGLYRSMWREKEGYNLSREALERLIEAARRSAPYPDLENTKSLSRSRVSPGLLRVYCEVIKSFYRLPCFFRLTRLDSTRLTHSRTAKSCFV